MVWPTIMLEGACSWGAMLGPHRWQVNRRQSQALDFCGHTSEGGARNFLPERPVLLLRVSGPDDDVRGILRDGGSTVQVRLPNSLYFPPHWFSLVMD
jgi:hypothetical protein